MTKFLLAIVALSFAVSAHATGTPTPPKDQPTAPHYVNINAASQSAADAAAAATVYANPVAKSKSAASVGAVTTTLDGGNSYSLMAAVPSHTVPPGLCIFNRSPHLSVGWGFVVYSPADSGTDMACVERLLTHAKEMAAPPERVVEYRMPPTDAIHPSWSKPAPVAEKAPHPVSAPCAKGQHRGSNGVCHANHAAKKAAMSTECKDGSAPMCKAIK